MTDRSEQLIETHKYLRKIIAGKGKLQGNFYFVASASGRDACLLVTLVARDKKGSKVRSQGRTIRKQVKSAKFALGIVLIDSNKLTFEVHGGSASPALLLKAFKKTLLNPDKGGIQQLRYLNKARIRKVQEDGQKTEVAAGESFTEAENVLLTQGAVSATELRVLQLQQGRLSSMNKKLTSSFLSQQTLNEEIAESKKESKQKITALASRIEKLSSKKDSKALRKAFSALFAERKNLADLESSGSNPFDTKKQTVDETFQLVMKASADQAAMADTLGS